MKMKKSIRLLLSLLLVFAMIPAFAEGNSASVSVESRINGYAYTYGKSTLKRALNSYLDYGENSYAAISITLADGTAVDDTKIDSSNSYIRLSNGDGYYADEYVLTADTLSGEWQNGTTVYALARGDFELIYDLYPLKDINSGREWSCLGGDGTGNYRYNFELGGIIYDGQELDPVVFPVYVHIYGYNYSADAANLYGDEGSPAIEDNFVSLSKRMNGMTTTDVPIWTWIGEGDKPILCDGFVDDFYITWPDGMDAAALTIADVHAELRSNYGDVYELVPETDYLVQSSETETQIAVVLQNWVFQPVYTTLSLTANGYTQDFDIASVYAYEAQQGGGGTTVDGTVTAYSFYGLANLSDWAQIMSPAIYVLSCQNGEETLYYAQDDAGKGIFVNDIAEAATFDASGEQDRDQTLIGNTLYVTTRRDNQEVEMTVGDETIAFVKTYPGRDSAISAGGSLLAPTDCDPSLEALQGYVIPWGTSNWITNEKWAWQKGIEKGWTGIDVTPYTGKFECAVAKGATQQFEATLNGEYVDVTWSIAGDVAEGTSVDTNGLVTVAEGEQLAQFAVGVINADGVRGSVTIKVE